MPTSNAWCEPELFLEHKGVEVFHTYVGDDMDQGPLDYWFTADCCSDDNHFDIRDFDTDLSTEPDIPFLSMNYPIYAAATDEQRLEWKRQWAVWHTTGFAAARKAILIEAIEKGLIKNPD